MKNLRNIIHQILNLKKGEKEIPSNDSLFVDKNQFEHHFQNLLPGGKVIVTIFLN